MKSHFIHKHEKIFSVIIYILAALFLFYEMALQVSPGVMTNELMSDFRLNAASLGVIAAFYFYSYTFMQIPAGLLYDKFGPRILITTSVIICSLGALFFGMTKSFQMLALGRFFMGIGSAFAFIGVLIVAARWFEERRFAMLVGIAQLLAAFGAMGGAFPLASMVSNLGWRTSINLLSIFGFVLSLLAAIFIRDYPKDHPHSHTNHYKLGLFKSLKELVKEAQAWYLAIYAFCSWAPIAIFAALWGVPYLEKKFFLLKTEAALAVSCMWLGLMIVSPLLGWLSDKIRRRKSLIVILAGVGTLASTYLLLTKNLTITGAYPLIFLMGAASSGQILTFALVKDTVKPNITATAIGFNNMAVVLGGAVFQPLVGSIISHFWNGTYEGGIRVYPVNAYEIALIIIPFCYFIGFLVSLFFIDETFCKNKNSSSDNL